MEGEQKRKWASGVLVAGIIGGGILLVVGLLVGLIVLPAIFALSSESSPDGSSRPVHASPTSKVIPPDTSGAEAPDFFEDLED